MSKSGRGADASKSKIDKFGGGVDDVIAAQGTQEADEEKRRFDEEYLFDSDRSFDSDQLLTTVRRRRPRYGDIRDEYLALWAELAIQRSKLGEIDAVIDKIVAAKSAYEVVQASTAIPWYFVAAIHNLESSLNFRRHLHNGDPLTARTRRVPAGRPPTGSPPFTWMESAIDALKLKGLDGNRDWSVSHMCYLFESYNGWGYRLYHSHVKSPYLWSFSNHYRRGKYISDGSWSETAVSNQIGAMILLKRLEQRNLLRFPSERDSLPLASSESARVSSLDSGIENRLMKYDRDELLMDESQEIFASGMNPGEEEREDPSSDDTFEERGFEGQFQARLRADDPPAQVPQADPVPFARSFTPVDQCYWPILTTNSRRFDISYRGLSGRIYGRSSRMFLASRANGQRYHVAIDLFANEGNVVVACEDGRVVNYYPFYSSSAGEMTYAMFLEHEDFVINYAEVKANARSEFGWRVGSRVRAGQSLARISSTDMLHFETYVKGTTQNHRWRPGQPRPRRLLNPTDYLLRLARSQVNE